MSDLPSLRSLQLQRQLQSLQDRLEHLEESLQHQVPNMPRPKVEDLAGEYAAWQPLKCALFLVPKLLSKQSAMAQKAVSAATDLLKQSCARISDGDSEKSVEIDKFPVVVSVLAMLTQMANRGDEEVIEAILRLLEMHALGQSFSFILIHFLVLECCILLSFLDQCNPQSSHFFGQDPAHWCVVRVVILKGRYRHTMNYEGVRRAAVKALGELGDIGNAQITESLASIVKDRKLSSLC